MKSGFVSGLIYAMLMTGVEYSQEQQINIWRFLLNIIVFGIIMILIKTYYLKKKINLL